MGKQLPRKPAKAIVFFNNAWYTLKDLTDTIDCANEEAQGYLDSLNVQRQSNVELMAQADRMKSEIKAVRELMTEADSRAAQSMKLANRLTTAIYLLTASLVVAGAMAIHYAAR